MSSTKTEIFRPTIFENMLILSRVPYTLSVILVGALIGPLGNFIYLYSVSNDALNAFYGTFVSVFAGESGFSLSIDGHWYPVIANLLWYAFLFYVAFLVKYLRMRLVKAEPELLLLAANGEETVRENFGIVSRVVPQMALVSIFLIVYATSVPELITRGELTVFSSSIYIIRSLLRSVMFGSILWLYGASLWGLYRFGKHGLSLKPYHEDPMLGTKKLASLSFSFSSAYFLGLSIFAAHMISGGLAGQMAVVNVVSMLVLVPVGIALFIAPLVSTHNIMVEAKNAEIALTGKLLLELIDRIERRADREDQDITELLMLESTEKKVMSMRTWPIENPLIGKFAAIAISVAAILIARLIQIALHI